MKLIHNLYIIKPNGICIFHQKYGSLEEDPQAIAGFLIAISMFSKATVGEEIKTLVTDNFKFVFKTDGKFVFVTFVDKTDNSNYTQQQLDEIKTLFYNNYPQAESVCQSGNLQIFEKFKFEIGDIVNKN